MLKKKTREQIVQDSIRAIQAGEDITNLNPGGVARTMVEAIGTQLADFYNVLELNMAMRYPSTAVGAYLDLLGESFGISRQQAQAGNVSAGDENIKFYVSSGVLLDKIPAGYIPASTDIYAGSGITYRTSVDTYFNDVDTEVFVSAQSTGTGTSYQVGPGMLTSHSLGVSGVSVTNVKSIANAVGAESDSSYRYRIVNFFRSIQRGNLQALRSAVLTIPNVADVRVNEYVSGPGTVDILLVPTTATLSDSALQRARFLVQLNKSMGTRVRISQPDYIPVKLSIRVSFVETVTPTQQTQIKNDVRTNLIDYIDDISIGGTLVINEIRQRVMQSSDDIFDMRIECFAVDGRPQLLSNYKLLEDQLFVLADTNPIDVK